MKNGFIRNFDLNNYKLFIGVSIIRKETDKQTEKQTNIDSEFLSVSLTFFVLVRGQNRKKKVTPVSE